MINKLILADDELRFGVNAKRILEFGVINYILFMPPTSKPYHGPVHQLFIFPFVYFFGLSTVSLRIGIILGATLTVVATYLFVKKFYGRFTAFLASFLLAIFPAHVILSWRAFEWVLTPFFVMVSLYILQEFYKSGNKKKFYFFSFWCALGTLVRLTFLFFLIPLSLLTFIIKPFGQRHLKIKTVCIGILIFLLTLYPLIKNLDEILEMAVSTLKGGRVNLLDFTNNLFNGITVNFITFFNESSFFFYFFILSFLYLLLDLFFIGSRNLTNFRKDVLLLTIFSIMTILLSTVTFVEFHYEDYILLAPFITVIIARALTKKLLTTEHLSYLPFYIIITFIVALLFSDAFHIFIKVFMEKPNENICHEYGNVLVDHIIQIKSSSLIVDTDYTTRIILWHFWNKDIIADHVNLHLSKKSIQYEGRAKYIVHTVFAEELNYKPRKELTEILKKIDKNNIGIYISTSSECIKVTQLKERNLTKEFSDIISKYGNTLTLKEKIYSDSGKVMYSIYSIN